MRIKEITTQSRRDFTAIMECEFCNTEWVNRYGYDDRNYHDNVIPRMKCDRCGKSTVSENAPIDHTETKYPDNFYI